MKERGFTLVEVLITLALVVIILFVLYGVLEQTLAAQGRIEAIMYGSEIGPYIVNLMRQDIEAAFLPDSDRSYFAGQDKREGGDEADRIDFVCSTLEFKQEEGEEPTMSPINGIGYQLRRNRERNGLLTLYRRIEYGVKEDPLKGGRLYELYDRVKSLTMEYFDGQEWQKSWDSKEAKGMPEAVKIVLVLEMQQDLQEEGLTERKFSTIITLPSTPKPTPPPHQ